MRAQLQEGTILLGNLVGRLSRTDQEGVYQFTHRRVASASSVQVYQNYFGRCERSAWTSSVGCGFEAVGELTLLEEGSGFAVLIRPTSLSPQDGAGSA